jgi:hypothetical protein
MLDRMRSAHLGSAAPSHTLRGKSRPGSGDVELDATRRSHWAAELAECDSGTSKGYFPVATLSVNRPYDVGNDASVRMFTWNCRI